MAVWHGRKGRMITGGKINLGRKKRKYELGSLPILTRVGKDKRGKHRRKGGIYKIKSYLAEYANVFVPKQNKTKKVKILTVLENKANPHFVRRNIITKGCIINTEIGKAKVTSRPSQHGIVNAILVEDKKMGGVDEEHN